MPKRFILAFLLLSLLLLTLKISKSLTSSCTNYILCIGSQGSLHSSQNYNLLLTLNSPIGTSSSLSYKLNLGFIPECIEGCNCNFNSICDSGETQGNCPTDCKTDLKIVPSKGLGGDEVNVTISFADSRYKHEIGTRIKIDLLVGSILYWNPSHDCFGSLTIILTSSEFQQTCDWNYKAQTIRCGNYVGNMTINYFPDKNKLEINGKCKLPQVSPGYYSVNTTVSFYLIKK